MTDSPIAEDYPYRIYEPTDDLVEVQKWYESRAAVTDPGGSYDGAVSVTMSDLTTPTRLDLQLAGDEDSPGGLLDEGDIQERDIVMARFTNFSSHLARVKTTKGDERDFGAILRSIDGEIEVFLLGVNFRLATPAELREVDIDSKEDDNNTRTCPRCSGNDFTIIETVLRERSGTLDNTGQIHCSELTGGVVLDRRLRCKSCPHEWRRENWEICDG